MQRSELDGKPHADKWQEIIERLSKLSVLQELTNVLSFGLRQSGLPLSFIRAIVAGLIEADIAVDIPITKVPCVGVVLTDLGLHLNGKFLPVSRQFERGSKSGEPSTYKSRVHH